eukprot:COSAG01_NODE_3528_length_5967_cov_14.678255_13_plen_106_part_00
MDCRCRRVVASSCSIVGLSDGRKEVGIAAQLNQAPLKARLFRAPLRQRCAGHRGCEAKGRHHSNELISKIRIGHSRHASHPACPEIGFCWLADRFLAAAGWPTDL